VIDLTRRLSTLRRNMLCRKQNSGASSGECP
jgi:hypothetical protein